jgi:prepilin-type N-terminal cleavage/methylation domain-containing protein
MLCANTEPFPSRRHSGVTLLELLISAALFSLVMGGVYLLYTTMLGTLNRGEMSSDIQQNARVALGRMVQELRMAGYDPQNALGPVTGQRSAELRAAGDNCLSFVTYRIDTETSPATERTVQVTYSLDGTTLRRKGSDWDASASAFSGGMTQPLANSVVLLAFTYYDALSQGVIPSGSTMGNCPPGTATLVKLLDVSQIAQIRRIGITVQTRDLQSGIFPESYRLTSHVSLRNR